VVSADWFACYVLSPILTELVLRYPLIVQFNLIDFKLCHHLLDEGPQLRRHSPVARVQQVHLPCWCTVLGKQAN
jgi:hypothetical protein